MRTDDGRRKTEGGWNRVSVSPSSDSLRDAVAAAMFAAGAEGLQDVGASFVTHLASSVNAPVTAFFCSTIPDFGFGPLSEDSELRETKEKLSCRPCGLHGFKVCPEGHFKCGEISLEQ